MMDQLHSSHAFEKYGNFRCSASAPTQKTITDFRLGWILILVLSLIHCVALSKSLDHSISSIYKDVMTV